MSARKRSTMRCRRMAAIARRRPAIVSSTPWYGSAAARPPVLGRGVEDPATREPLDRGGDGSRRQAQPLGQDPGVGAAVLGQPVDGLEGLPVAFRQTGKLIFDGSQVRFR